MKQILIGKLQLIETDIDIVDVNTPNDSHAEIAIAAAQAGKHVLCEKPLAMNVAECKEMLAVAKKAKIVHMVCHNYRRIPAIAHAKKMIEEGALGEIYPRCIYGICGRPEYENEWRANPQLASGGQFIEQGSHANRFDSLVYGRNCRC